MVLTLRRRALCLLLSGGLAFGWHESAFGQDYEEKEILGWRVWISQKLLLDRPDLARAVLGEIEVQFSRIVQVVPAQRHRFLKSVQIWVELAAPGVSDAVYHSTAAGNGIDPRKGKSIEIASAQTFVSKSKNWHPWTLFHELAHAYHHEVIGINDRSIHDAYNAAVKGGLYASVKNLSGQAGRAYALTNEREYFAELSEAYFGGNFWYPHTREQLFGYDRTGHDLVKRLWEAP